MHDAGDSASPSRLVTRAQPCAIVTMKIFVKQDVIAPMRIGLELLGSAIDWAPAIRIFQKDICKPPADLLSYLVERHQSPGPCRALNLKGVAEVGVVLEQGAKDQSIHRQPDGPSPVRIAAEHTAIGLRR